jgi:hypothetical protein
MNENTANMKLTDDLLLLKKIISDLKRKLYHNMKQKEYNRRNKEKRRIYDKQYRSINKEKIAINDSIRHKKYYSINKEKINKRNSLYYNNGYEKRRKSVDINFKLRKLLRTRLQSAMRGNYKSGSAVRDLGCSIDELKIHLEKQFKSGMNWQNHGKFGWHIDHIKPLSSFDLTNPQQLKEAVHHTNLQPLWWQENLSKQKC